MSLRPVREAPRSLREPQPFEPITVQFGRMIFIVEQLTRRIRFLERSLSLLIFALFLMTTCNVLIIARVFYMGEP